MRELNNMHVKEFANFMLVEWMVQMVKQGLQKYEL
jgi:hypothetical protein